MLRISQTLNDVDSKILSTLKKIESPLWDAYGYPTQTATSELAALTGLDPVDIYYSLKFIRSVNAYDEVSGLPNDPVFDPPLVAKLNDVLNAGGDTKQLASEKCLNLNDLPDPSWCEPSPIELTLNNALVECHRRDVETGVYDYRARLEFDPETGRLKQIPLETKTAYSRDEALHVLNPLLDSFEQAAVSLDRELARANRADVPNAFSDCARKIRIELGELPAEEISHEKVAQARDTLVEEIRRMAHLHEEIHRVLPTSAEYLENLENLEKKQGNQGGVKTSTNPPENPSDVTVLAVPATAPTTASATASLDALKEIPDEYPLWTWAGTDYETFAQICGRNNYIPREFLIESLKTIVGAAAGHLIGVERRDLEARFYTVLIGGAGTGKSTAMKWAKQVLPQPLCYTYGKPSWKNLGCFMGSFGSQVGLIKKAKDDRQILQFYDEFSTLADKFRINGSGLSFLSLVNQLYEKVLPPTNIVKDDAKIYVERPLHHSILAATTPDVWERTFGGTGSEGSGFFQRLNIIASDESRTVANLEDPDEEELKSKLVPLVDKIKTLRKKPYKFPMTESAAKLLHDWFQSLNTLNGKDGLDTGRLQVLTLRNAAHLGWLLDVQPDTPCETSPVEVIRRAISLSNYQLAMRQKYQPICGDSVWAQAENLLVRHIQKERIITRTKLYRNVHASRYGIKVFAMALENLEREGLILREKIESKGTRKPVEILRWNSDR